MEDLAGLFAPLVTPFTDDGSAVSEVRLARLVRHLNERGIAGYVACSDSGEFLSLSFSERKAVLEFVLRESQGRPVLAHVSSLNTATSLDLAQHAARHGARAAILMPPYYGAFSDEEVAAFGETVAEFAGLPIVVVDPHARVNEAILGRWAGKPGIHIAGPMPQPNPYPSSSDSFALGQMVVAPAALLRQRGDLGELDDLLRKFGGKRIGKAGLALQGLEVGSPRSPAQLPAREVQARLRELLED